MKYKFYLLLLLLAGGLFAGCSSDDDGVIPAGRKGRGIGKSHVLQYI